MYESGSRHTNPQPQRCSVPIPSFGKLGRFRQEWHPAYLSSAHCAILIRISRMIKNCLIVILLILGCDGGLDEAN